jgi:PAS domain S-box-containing protein
MMPKLNIFLKLYLLVLVMSALMIVIAVFGISGMKTMKQNSNSLIADRIFPLQQLTTIRYNYATNILSATEELRNKSITVTTAENRIHNAQLVIDTIWQAYLKTYLTPQEQQLANQTTILMATAGTVINDFVQQIHNTDSSTINLPDNKRLYILIDPVIAKLNELVQLQINVGTELGNENNRLYTSTSVKYYIILVVFLIIGGLLALLIIGNTRLLIKSLYSSNQKFVESEEQYRLLFNNSPGCIVIWDLETLKVLKVNDEAIEKYGYSKEEWQNMSLLQFRPAEEYENIKSFAKNALAGVTQSIPSKIISTHLKKNGEPVQMQVIWHLINYNGHKASISLARDITEELYMQNALRESEERMSLFVEYSPASLAMFDNEMRYIAMSQKWRIDNDLKDQNIIGRNHYEVVPGVSQEWKDGHQRSLKGAIERKEEDLFIHKDGTVDWLRWEIRPWYKTSGEIGGIIMFTEVITEQKESELKFKNLVEKSLVGVYIVQKGKFVYVNPKFAQDLGYTQEEILHLDNLQDIRDVEHIPPALIEWRKKVETGIIDDFHAELKYKKKDGTIIWAEVYCGETSYNGAKAILGSFQDITERKNAEAVVKEQAETFAAIIENANESIWLLSPELEVLQFNKTAKERIRLNGDKEVYRGANFREFLHFGTDNIFMPMFNDAVAGKYVEKESFQANIHGNEFWLRTKMYPVYNTRKELIGVTVLAENITERKKVETALEQSEEKHRALVENITDAIVMLDENSQVIYQSPSAMRITGYSFDDRTGGHPFEFVYKEDTAGVNEIVQRSMNEPGVPINYQLRLNHKDGNIIWIEATILNLLHNESVKALVVNYRDITARKKATELFKTQFENTPDIILIVNRDLAIETINRTNPNGPSVEEVIGKDSIEVLPEESRSIAKEAMLKCFETGQNQQIENLIRNDRWISSRFVPIATDGVVNQVMIIGTDITAQKNAQEKLKQSEERHRSLIENIGDAIIMLDAKGNTTYRSPSAQNVTGFTTEELAGKTIFDIVHPNDLPTLKQSYMYAIANPGVPVPGQFRIRHKNGEYIWTEGITKNLLHDKAIHGLVINYRDISERKKFEEQQLLMSSIVNSSDDAIISKTLDGIITSWNAGAEKVLGYTANEIIGKNISLLLPDDLQGEEKTILNKIAKGISFDHYETRRQRKDGEIIDVSLTISPIIDSTGIVVGSSKILRDITDQKRAEEKLMRAEIKAQEDERYEIGAELHDNVGQILTASSISLAMLKKTAKIEDNHFFDDTKTHITMALREIRNLSHRLAPAFFDNASLESAVTYLLRSFNVENNCEFNLVFEESVKAYPISRDLQLNLYRILQEQLKNILKYAKATKVEVAISLSNDILRMNIFDNGVGFDVEKSVGGIGMANMKRRAELFSGNFIINSAIGKGCKVIVEIPLSSAD